MTSDGPLTADSFNLFDLTTDPEPDTLAPELDMTDPDIDWALADLQARDVLVNLIIFLIVFDFLIQISIIISWQAFGDFRI